MRRSLLIIPLLTCLFLSCSKEDTPYPSIITAFAEMRANDKGIAESITLDDGHSYSITNTIANLKPQAAYRVVCGYVVDDQRATLYSLEPAYVLRDSTDTPRRDPTGVLSAWRSSQFINMHLRPLTQGGTQYWGFITDSITKHHAHLSLYHRQAEDPISYSCDVYASLPLDSLKGISQGDTITLSINTFGGVKSWTMFR